MDQLLTHSLDSFGACHPVLSVLHGPHVGKKEQISRQTCSTNKPNAIIYVLVCHNVLTEKENHVVGLFCFHSANNPAPSDSLRSVFQPAPESG